LYESGKITYMRTDSTALSKEAVGMIKKYVNENYGEKYYQYRDYKSKDENSQEAHECIRKTYMEENIEGDNIKNDMKRIYRSIYKRTVASLMAQAVFDVQTINIDIVNCLPKDTFYQAVFEELKFDGYLAVYNNQDNNKDDSESRK